MRGVVVMSLYPGRMFQEGMGTLLLGPLRPARSAYVLTPNTPQLRANHVLGTAAIRSTASKSF
jgi:hypothetical protein